MSQLQEEDREFALCAHLTGHLLHELSRKLNGKTAEESKRYKVGNRRDKWAWINNNINNGREGSPLTAARRCYRERLFS